MRFELAKAALTGLLASPNRAGGPEEYAEDALRHADALLAALNITPETVVESQQVSAGIVTKTMLPSAGMSSRLHNVLSAMYARDWIQSLPFVAEELDSVGARQFKLMPFVGQSLANEAIRLLHQCGCLNRFADDRKSQSYKDILIGTNNA